MKIVDEKILDGAITSLADAIRERGHFSEKMTFPDGFISKISSGAFYSAQTKYITPSDEMQIIYPDAEYGAINKLVIYGDANLIPSNINATASIFGVQGTYTSTINDYINGTITAEENSKITYLPSYFYYGRSLLSEVVFKNVINLGSGVFIGCSSLKRIRMDKIADIPSHAFYGLSLLNEIYMPECETVSDYGFGSCKSLESVTFSKCSIIGSRAFTHCDGLLNITFPECTTVSDAAFYCCYSIESVYIPKCVSIGHSAFCLCTSIKNAEFPECTYIGYYAFERCRQLSSIILPKCSSIQGSAFYSCSVLMNVHIMASSVAKLAGVNVFSRTPIAGYTYYTSGYGSIYVPSSLYSSYIISTNWSYYSSRIVGV